jgi:succinyl-CoA synthetase beta subunit
VKLYEHQAKKIFEKAGIPIPRGKVISSLEMVAEAYHEVGPKIVIKAQVLTGGRGKAGGIKTVDTLDEAKQISAGLLGSRLKGLEVRSVLFEERLDVAREYYLAIVNDRERSCPLAMMSMKGGMTIEDVAKAFPDQLAMQPVNILYGLEDYQIRETAFRIGMPFSDFNSLVSILKRLYQVYRCHDAELIEINPLIVTKQGKLVAGDARLNIDDNALFRHPEFKEYLEIGIDREFKAKKGNAFLELDGDIGVICTGAGMTMTMMDQIVAYGGNPADFMDAGWGMLEGAAEEGIKLLLAKGVKVILISTYSGGRTDIMAEKILEGLQRIGNLNIPIVIRLQGKNEEQAHKILSECHLPYVRTAETLDKAVALAVQIAKGEAR